MADKTNISKNYTVEVEKMFEISSQFEKMGVAVSFTEFFVLLFEYC